MTTNTIKANPFAIFTAAHAEARRLRENWPTVAYRDLFRAALKKVYEELRNLNAKIARKVREAAKSGIEGFGKVFYRMAIEAAKAAKPLSVAEKLIALGGNRWTKGRRKERTKMNIGPEKFTDAELEAMPRSQLEKLHEDCRVWMNALKICPEFWAYSALSGRIEALWDRRYEEYVREYRNPDGTWRDPR